jgi:hypothetical protein
MRDAIFLPITGRLLTRVYDASFGAKGLIIATNRSALRTKGVKHYVKYPRDLFLCRKRKGLRMLEIGQRVIFIASDLDALFLGSAASPLPVGSKGEIVRELSGSGYYRVFFARISVAFPAGVLLKPCEFRTVSPLEELARAAE